MGYTVLGKVSDNIEQKSQQGYKVLGSMADRASAVATSASESISSVAQSVGDTVGQVASRAASVGSQVVDSAVDMGQQVAGAAFNTINNMDSSIVNPGDVPEGTRMTAFGERVGSAAVLADKGLKALESTPIAMMLDDIFVPALGRKITEGNFSEEATGILRQMALDNNLKPGDSLKVEYEDFNKYGARMSARFVSGSNEDTADLLDKLSDLSPADEIKMTLGEAMISVDQDGNIKVTDQYDFNSWAYYGEGKGSDGRYSSFSADEFEKSDISFTEALMDTIRNSPSDYQMARNLSFLFGSRDYEDDSRDTGRKVEISLGKIE